jgi:N-acyl-D-amino-acid deacylase
MGVWRAGVVVAWMGATLSVDALSAERADVLIRNGVIYDGSGGDPVVGDVAIANGLIAAAGPNVARRYTAEKILDARGLAVAPGFVNALSWATESLLHDGRAMSDLKQGVTMLIFGEGSSPGPVNAEIAAEMLRKQTDVRYEFTWTTLGQYLDTLAARGVAPNVASFVGASTVRAHVLGFEDRQPSEAQLRRMQALVREAMDEGALGVGSALIYAPGAYARTDELIALAQAAGESGGAYISHLRSEGDRFLEALDEALHIGREANVHTEIYHLKAAGRQNWPKMRVAIDKIEAARQAGMSVAANMYPYTAAATGLDAAMPPWVQAGGIDAWVERLQDPAIRARVLREMRSPSGDWESLYLAAGSPENVRVIGVKNGALKGVVGKSLAQIAKERGVTPEDAAIDLVIEDRSQIATAYELMSEDNVALGLAQPWVSIGSDAGALAPEGVFLTRTPHPRAYGSFARFLGRYVRDLQVTRLQDAIFRLSRLPAQNFKLRGRGCLNPGCHADIAIFDPARIADHATFDQAHRYASGVVHVFVNGVQVIREGEHTGALPGEVIRGPGWRGWSSYDGRSGALDSSRK